MTQQQFIKDGKKKGISNAVLKFAWDNKQYCFPLLQDVAMMSAMACGPRPAPKLDPGYWECVNGSWEWVEAV